MIQRPWTLVSSFVMSASVGIVACSSSDTPETGDDSGSGGSSTGGTATGGTATGGTGGGGNPAECKGISRDMPCTMEGLQCPNLVCGLADSGTRDCNCATTWMCTSCDFTNSPFRDMPPTIEPCPTGVAPDVSCDPSINNTVCGPLADGDYCACYMDAQDGQIWDCDGAPSSWGI